MGGLVTQPRPGRAIGQERAGLGCGWSGGVVGFVGKMDYLCRLVCFIAIKGNIEILTNMKKTLTILASALLLAGAATSCASLDKMAEMAEKVKVTCNPEILEAVGGNVDAVVTVTYPADYFNPKAILEVTPVIVYDGGEASAKKLIYQGEKVKDNYRVVSSDGQTVNANIHFEYAYGMEKCHLELRGVAMGKGKSVKLEVSGTISTAFLTVSPPAFFPVIAPVSAV